VRFLSGQSPVIRAGLALFVLGLVFIAIDVVPFFFHDHNTPLWLNLACLLAPAGFAIAVGSGLRDGRREARAAARAVDGQSAAG
jgi:peptidoglycan/LPS O-acetylase OafA/YrhL